MGPQGHYKIKNPGAGQQVTKYYLAGAQRIAVRANSTLYFLLADHLGSTSITTDASGNKLAELRYKPWGETRFSSGTTPTNYRYTGQREEASFGWYFYNARWYDPYITQFSQPDSIIPDPYNSQDWNRYAYASNNPLKNIDPTGHDDIPWWAIIKFLAGQLIDNHRISDSDWEQAANTYVPASERGSNLTAQAVAVIPPASGVIEANYVTTADGDFQLYITTGEGAGAGAGASIGYSQGAINGSGFNSADDFAGLAAQGTLGLNLPVAIGSSVDVWSGLKSGADGEPMLSNVNGYDAGVSLGTPGGAATVTVQNAVSAGDVVNSLLTNTGLINSPFGQAYNKYAQSVTSFKMTGFRLFACRVAQQCGRWSHGEWSSDE